MSTKQTNYEKHFDKVVELICSSALCFSCLARKKCKVLGEENGCPMCKEAWNTWLKEKE